METAKIALTEFRTIQKSRLTIGALAKMDRLIEAIRNEGQKIGLATFQMATKIEGPEAIWRKEWR